MGNSVQRRKKVGTEKKLNALWEKPKGFWWIGRTDKQKIGAGSKAGDDLKKLTVHFSAAQHFQENVFIEGDRPQYLEDLHSEALQGLKILQQKDQESGVNFAEDESFVGSSETPHEDDDLSYRDDEEGSLESNCNSGMTDSRTSVSTKPALTRQGSTFKPLHPVKGLEKGKKRTRRTTIMGIPNQVQKELGLQSGSTFQPIVSPKLPNHDDKTGIFTIPTIEGGTSMSAKEGARVHLSELEISEDKQEMKLHLHPMFKDEEPLNQQGFGTRHCRPSVIRPKSVVAPGMTTFTSFNHLTTNFLMESQGPVMSVSPQATYLSTIIPNAVLPASVEVIEIDCCSLRGNGVNHGGGFHTVSKSSLASASSSASPCLSKKLGSDDSQTERSFKQTTTSGTTHKVDLNLQESWVDCSRGQEPTSLDTCPNSRNNSEKSSTDKDSELDIPRARRDEAKIKRHSPRSLSIMKTKLPPAPPRRSNSLHNNKISPNSKSYLDEDRNCSTLQLTTTENAKLQQVREEVNTILNPVINFTESNSSHASSTLKTSSGETTNTTELVSEMTNSLPKKTSPEGDKFERTISPSSGYSSQSGTPTLSSKEIPQISLEKQKMKPVKPERSVSRASSSASPSSSLTSLSSGTSETVNTDISNSCTTSLPPISAKESSPSFGMERREPWNVPPPPKVKAPCAPPPETWLQNSHAFTLLCGPSPQVSEVYAESTSTSRGAQIQDEHVESGTETGHFANDEQNQEKTVAPENHSNPEQVLCAVPVQEDTDPAEDRTETKAEMDDVSCCNIATKQEPPSVQKKPLLIEDNMLTERQQIESCNTTREETSISTNETEEKMDTETPSIQGKSVSPEIIEKTSPPPSPPPAYQPTPPLTRKSPSTSVSTSPVQEENRLAESSWPPPPPPLESDSVFDGGDEIEFPLPPPPDITENIPTVMDTCPRQMEALETGVNTVEEFVKTNLEANDTETSVTTDPVLPQPNVCDEENPDSHTETVRPVLDNPPSPSMVPSEIQTSVTGKTLSGSFLKRLSLEIQCPSTTETTVQPFNLVTSSSPMENLTTGVTFRKPPNTAHRDNRGKELLARHKSTPIPKEDANIPLVTPSLLHMVRLRTVSTPEDNPSEEQSTNEGGPIPDSSGPPSVGQQNIPAKPTYKSLESPIQVRKTYITPNTPSMRLQEAIRIKTAAMSSRESLPCRMGTRPSYPYPSEQGLLSLKASETYDTHRLPSSTASFIFARSTKRILAETGLDQVEEPRRVPDRARTASYSSGGLKSDRLPPPVARKPLQGSVSFSPNRHTCPARTEPGLPTGAPENSKGIALPETTTRVTADTIETLF
ncbi:NHS-like protein 3 isoform X2 [Stigmatopora nigra]